MVLYLKLESNKDIQLYHTLIICVITKIQDLVPNYLKKKDIIRGWPIILQLYKYNNIKNHLVDT